MSDNPKLRKNGGEGTKSGNFLRTITGVGGPLLKLVGSLTGLEPITKIANMISSDPAMSEAQKEIALNLLELDYKDLQSARDMQVAIATSANSTKLSKNFIYYLAGSVFLFSMVIVLLLFFKEIPEKNRDVVNFILGVIIGTGLTGIFNYFFGSSKGSKDKEELLSALNK
jgi:uncharacterized membrane protein